MTDVLGPCGSICLTRSLVCIYIFCVLFINVVPSFCHFLSWVILAIRTYVRTICWPWLVCIRKRNFIRNMLNMRWKKRRRRSCGLITGQDWLNPVEDKSDCQVWTEVWDCIGHGVAAGEGIAYHMAQRKHHHRFHYSNYEWNHVHDYDTECRRLRMTRSELIAHSHTVSYFNNLKKKKNLDNLTM